MSDQEISREDDLNFVQEIKQNFAYEKLHDPCRYIDVFLEKHVARVSRRR